MSGFRTPLSRLSTIQSAALAHLPRALVILLENALAHEPEPAPQIAAFETWLKHGHAEEELPFYPARILMQDTAGVAALADLAALRDYAADRGHPAEAVDAAIPIDLVIDHSVRADHSGKPGAAALNHALEYARNDERYRFFKWAEQAFPKLRVTPPGQGICHQINLEQLTCGTVPAPGGSGWTMAETVIGTDSHTTMVNALGVLGWGVGGIEAELAALGLPVPIPLPAVTEVVITGRRVPGVTGADIALHFVARLRAAGVVDQIVEFAGEGLDGLTVPDRAAIANMCPEYGATAALFPVDAATLGYFAEMGRSPAVIENYKAYALATGLWRDSGPPRRFTRSLTVDLAEMAPVMAGPSHPQQLRRIEDVPASLRDHFSGAAPPEDRTRPGDGAIAIAAITSCTNTANPELMVAAGMLARNAVERGLAVPSWVKTTLSPGSRRIAGLLERSGLQASLDALGFHVTGFGCMTCVGNSGDLAPELAGPEAPALTVSLLSGNRNFESRIHPQVRANYLASPPMVVAGALAGNLFVDLSREPLGHDRAGVPVYLADIWPSADEIGALLTAERDAPTDGTGQGHADASWAALETPRTLRFAWRDDSTFLRQPPFFSTENRSGAEDAALADIVDARVLLVLGDDVTTDHISPIGRIAAQSPAGRWLIEHGVGQTQLGGYGDRRANHHVMLRGAFDNPRLANRLAPAPGNRTLMPDGSLGSVFEAASLYGSQGAPLVIVAHRNYGTGSARDWAAKGTALLGVRAVLARSFERIHRANLIALGVAPILVDEDFPDPGGADRVSVLGLGEVTPDRREVTVEVSSAGLPPRSFRARVDARSASQIGLLQDGGLFAGMRRRFDKP